MADTVADSPAPAQRKRGGVAAVPACCRPAARVRERGSDVRVRLRGEVRPECILV